MFATIKKRKLKKKILEFDLLTNGLDFILSSIKSVVSSKNELTLLKYAILNISAGKELLFKERLSREHWSLIFEKIDQANKSKLIEGDFISVNSNTCLMRLENITLIKFTSEEKKLIESLRKKRNKIEHFQVNENTEALTSFLSKILILVINFIEREFSVDKFSFEQKEIYQQIRIKSSEFEKFVKLKLAQLSDKLKGEPWLKECSHCLQKTVCVDEVDNKLRCLFCHQTDDSTIILCPECKNKSMLLDGWNMKVYCLVCDYTDEPEKVTDNYLKEILDYCSHSAYMDGDDSMKTLCFECGNDTLIKEEETYICLSCQNNWDEKFVTICNSCGELCHSNPELKHLAVCDSCQHYRQSKE